MIGGGAVATLVVAAFAVTGLFALKTGCIEADLEEGRYSCDPQEPGRCPPGWSCSWSRADDGYRCFKGPEPLDRDGDGGAAEVDGGPDAAVSMEECGNDECEGEELCDGVDLQGRDCESLGHTGGTLMCEDDCSFDESGCFDCGDGVCEAWKGESAGICPEDCN